jgi:hypothetical protein
MLYCLVLEYPYYGLFLKISMPGRTFPSSHSKKAPPAVLINVKSSAADACFKAATVSPPPATETICPAFVNCQA